MKDYIAIASVHYYDEIDNITRSENIVLTEVRDYADAMTRIESCYKNSLESCQITLLEGPFLVISDDSFNKIMKEEI